MKLQDENYKILFDHTANRLCFQGALRLSGTTDYDKVLTFILEVHDLDIPFLEMDFTGLEFLNSAGISTLCQFIFAAKKADKLTVRLIGKQDILWQKKSFANLKQLWSRVELVLT
jgi:hypothetical protein